MEPGGSMPHLQGISNNPYPETKQPNSPYSVVGVQKNYSLSRPRWSRGNVITPRSKVPRFKPT